MNSQFFHHGKLCLLLLFLAGKAFGTGIKVYTIKKDLIIGVPGKLSTIFIQIENNEATTLLLEPQITVPEGWNPIFESEKISIPPNQKINKLVSIYIPHSAESKQYTVGYQLNATNQTAITTAIEIPVAVQENVDLSISGIYAPEYVIAGEVIEASFLVQNTGNSNQTVLLQAYNCELNGAFQIDLSPNQVHIVDVVSSTEKNTFKVSRKSFRIEASILQDSLLKKHAYLHTKIIPNSEAELNDIRRLPGYFNLSYIGRKQQTNDYVAGWQGELFSRGKLDKSGEHLVELRLRGPNQFNVSSLGQYDEYYAKYVGPKYQTQIGDQNFSLSTLTELARYGRGVSIKMRYNKLELGSFMQRPRFFPDLNGEIGVFAKHHFNQKNTISVNLLRKNFNNETANSHIWSVSGLFYPFKNTKIETEIAQGTSINGLGYGGFINFESKPIKKIRITGLLLYADNNFNGYYNNTINYSTNLNYQINKKISLFANIYQDERNFAQDTLYATAPFSKQWQSGFNLRLSKQLNIKGYVRQRELKDQLPSKKFHRLNRFIRAQITQKWRNFQFSASGEYGTTENFLNQESNRISNFLRSYFDVNYRLNNRLRLRGFVQFFDNQRGNSVTQRQLIFGLTGNAKLTKSTELNFQYQNNFDLEEYYRDRNQMEARLSQYFGKWHRLSVNSRYALQRQTVNQGDFSIVAQYQYRFGVPLEKNALNSDVIGQITNDGTNSLEGIILNLNGQKAMTDTNGKFKFKSLSPGSYFLFVDKASLGVHQIPSIQTPIPVEIFANEDTEIAFGITNSADIKGHVSLKSAPIYSSIQKKNQELPGPLLIEIKNKGETLRQITASDGTFNFTGIRPGQWVLNIIDNENYQHYIFEEKSFEMEINSGQAVVIDVKVRKKERKIKFLQNLSLSNTE